MDHDTVNTTTPTNVTHDRDTSPAGQLVFNFLAPRSQIFRELADLREEVRFFTLYAGRTDCMLGMAQLESGHTFRETETKGR